MKRRLKNAILGFTLVEMRISAGIMAIIVTALFAGISSSFTLYDFVGA